MARTNIRGTQITDASVDLTVDITGTLPVANGGTGAATLSGVLVGNGTSAVTAVAAPSGAIVGTTDSQTLSSKTLTTPVLNGAPTGTGVASAATASTLALRDANGNLTAAAFLEGYSTTVTAAGATTLTVGSSYNQFFTGTTTQTLVLPVASTLVLGQQWLVTNISTGAVTVQSSGANAVVVLAGGASAVLTCILISGTSAASWQATYFGSVITSGKSLSASNTLTLAGTDATTITFQGTDTYIGRATTDTLTNKRMTRRATTTAGPGATPTIATDTTDYAEFTALATAITSMTTNLSGTPVRGDNLWISLTDNGTARAITWGASFEASGSVALPTTTVISTRLDIAFTWNVATSKWRCLAAA